MSDKKNEKNHEHVSELIALSGKKPHQKDDMWNIFLLSRYKNSQSK